MQGKKFYKSLTASLDCNLYPLAEDFSFTHLCFFPGAVSHQSCDLLWAGKPLPKWAWEGRVYL